VKSIVDSLFGSANVGGWTAGSRLRVGGRLEEERKRG
jgi:hypothetical protein